jgi:hypothetical protein
MLMLVLTLSRAGFDSGSFFLRFREKVLGLGSFGVHDPARHFRHGRNRQRGAPQLLGLGG